MHDFLKNIAEENDWEFEYSRTDYQNLYNAVEDGKVYMFVDPITSDSKFSDAGNETLTYSGKLMLLMSSNVDEDYKDKYEQYIKPLSTTNRKILVDSFACSDYQLNTFKVTEIINLFDQNMDGLLITYSATLVN